MRRHSNRAGNGKVLLLLFLIVGQICHVVEILIATELVAEVAIDDVLF